MTGECWMHRPRGEQLDKQDSKNRVEVYLLKASAVSALEQTVVPWSP